MHIHRVSLRPFGRFADRDVDLAPGLNVVYGPNEAGKSTLHQALLTAVGGIRRGSGRRHEVEELRTRYRPWDGAAWRVGAIVELADGTRVELARNLDQSNGSRVTELGTGRDRAGELIVDGAPDGWRWLGLNRATYPATASVRQADVLRVGESSGLLAEQMQLAADTAGTDATAARAIERIGAYQREHVGSLSRTSVHPLRQAIVAVEQAQSRLDEAREAHAGYLRLAAEAQRLEQVAGARARERRAVEAALAAHRAHDERRELERVEELRLHHPAPPPDPTADDRLAQSAAAALSAWSCTREPAPVEGTSALELQRRLDALPEMPLAETAPDPSVRQAAQ
ncbi:MAG: AAA family ATPase, partial [Candidatus Dormibacteraceae bacterium]